MLFSRNSLFGPKVYSTYGGVIFSSLQENKEKEKGEHE